MSKWFVVLLMAALTVLACDSVWNAPTPTKVEYRVTGSTRGVNITYANAYEGTSQVEDCGIPWSYSWTGGRSGQFLYVSAQNEYDFGSVTVSIYVNDDLWKTSTSSGAYVIATAYGSKP